MTQTLLSEKLTKHNLLSHLYGKNSYAFFCRDILFFLLQSKYNLQVLTTTTRLLRTLTCTLLIPAARTRRAFYLNLVAFTTMIQRWPVAVRFRSDICLLRWSFQRYYLWDFWLTLIFQILPRRLNKPAQLTELPYHFFYNQNFRVWLQSNSYTQDRWFDCFGLNNLTLCLHWKFRVITKKPVTFLAGWVFWQNFLRAINCPIQIRR